MSFGRIIDPRDDNDNDKEQTEQVFPAPKQALTRCRWPAFLFRSSHVGCICLPLSLPCTACSLHWLLQAEEPCPTLGNFYCTWFSVRGRSRYVQRSNCHCLSATSLPLLVSTTGVSFIMITSSIPLCPPHSQILLSFWDMPPSGSFDQSTIEIKLAVKVWHVCWLPLFLPARALHVYLGFTLLTTSCWPTVDTTPPLAIATASTLVHPHLPPPPPYIPVDDGTDTP